MPLLVTESQNTKKKSYLNQLPEASLGDHTKGEIEILTDGLLNTRKFGIVFKDQYITVVRDPVVFPNKAIGTYLRVFSNASLNGSAGVVLIPFTKDHIYFRKIFRHPTRRWELELPRGSRQEGKSDFESAISEFAEEMGFKYKKIRHLGEICPDSGLLADVVQIYAFMVDEESSFNPSDKNEALGELVALRGDQLAEKVRKGEIRDGFSLAALMMAEIFSEE